ncbi:hypothetical protein C8F04DRAFT_1264362 [Mycena alexandri]|uniref:Glycosyltransferase family 25 protein n=1 Tax=Mycena alexandri TaxID=1745969 RepID=A0AAD6SM04_9AGAR|nr:hypothetical protein C8F04DRAFT_1264362 [Mycena alexandri]
MASICFLAVYHIRQGDLNSNMDVPTVHEDYRQRLGTARETDGRPHSKTLGVGRIYAVGFPDRVHQQEEMARLACALDIDLTWHNGTNYSDKNVPIIIERVRWWRDMHRVHSTAKNKFKFEWSDDIHEGGPLELKGADLWTEPLAAAGLPGLPALPVPDRRPPLHTIYGEDGFLPDQIDAKLVAHWKSHYDVLRKIAEGGDEVAIVFEDDIDVEWMLENRLKRLLPALPSEWDVLMLGHCSSKETDLNPLPSNPFLHPSTNPRCTNGYAVTRRGAQRLVRRLRTPAFAFSRPIDHAFAHIVELQRRPPKNAKPGMHFFSVYPPVVVQQYTSRNDTQVERLEDSTRERMELEGPMHTD